MNECSKVKFRHEAIAREYLKRYKKTSTKPFVLQDCYLCEKCNCWHLTKRKPPVDLSVKLSEKNKQLNAAHKTLSELRKLNKVLRRELEKYTNAQSLIDKFKYLMATASAANKYIRSEQTPSQLPKEDGGKLKTRSPKDQDPCFYCGKTLREQMKGCNDISCYRQFLNREGLGGKG